MSLGIADHSEAVKLQDTSDRRFFIKQTSDDIPSPDVIRRCLDMHCAELMYSYLWDETLVDCTDFIRGRAPVTLDKMQQIARQRPPAAAFLQQLAEDPDFLVNYERNKGVQQDIDALHRLQLHSLCDMSVAPFLTNAKAAYKEELKGDHRSGSAKWIPICKNYLHEAMQQYFRGERFHGHIINKDSMSRTIKEAGILSRGTTWALKTDGIARKVPCYAMPSAECLRALLIKKKWWQYEDMPEIM